MSVARSLALLGLFVALFIRVGRLLSRRAPRTLERAVLVDTWIHGAYPSAYEGTYEADPDVAPFHEWGARLRRFDAGESTPEERDALIVEYAFHLELRARRAFAGLSFVGTMSRHGLTLVWSSHFVPRLRDLLDSREPGPEARACLDRALSWWKAALDAGLAIHEWDDDGYEVITGAFRGLERFRSREVPVDPSDHGVRESTTSTAVKDPIGWIEIGEIVALAAMVVALIAM